ncbi:MAG TPA: G1 family glutamic endopeptidase [Actinospica sp.]|jgi:hypothetical protein|nr:G1 family glutamic endopeptidase [Actinospica sp.]
MLKNRALSAALLAALACAAGTDTAHAASAASAAGQAPDARGVSGVSIPASSLSLLSHAVRDHHTPPGKTSGKSSGTMKSTNWAGYAVTGGTYTSVSANWIEPSVTCTSNGIVGFWVGLDGWGSTSVEQDGTGVDCSKGTPQQFAWWETYPANSVQVYGAPVAAGDQMSSSIVAQPHGKYVMVLTDWTQRWTVRNPATLPVGKNASAEIVAEAVTAGSDITTLPDFGAIGFTNASINRGSLQAAGAQSIDMTDALDNVIATTTDADPNSDFIVNYTGTLASAPLRRASHLLGAV